MIFLRPRHSRLQATKIHHRCLRLHLQLYDFRPDLLFNASHEKSSAVGPADYDRWPDLDRQCYPWQKRPVSDFCSSYDHRSSGEETLLTGLALFLTTEYLCNEHSRVRRLSTPRSLGHHESPLTTSSLLTQ